MACRRQDGGIERFQDNPPAPLHKGACRQIKNRLKKILETSLDKTIPAVPLKLRKNPPSSRSNKRYPLTQAYGRTYCAWGSALRLGRDGYLDSFTLAHTNRQLSERSAYLTVFVKAFFNIAHTLSCPRSKVKCFSLSNKKFF